jgi:shikimate dehydrogenase
VLGAGGAARGILGPLLKAKPSKLCLVNRTISKAQEMEVLFASVGRVQASGYEGLSGQQFDLIINATSASLTGALPPLPENVLAHSGVCYDLAYSEEPTAFVQWGKKQGANLSVDGLGMLVEQAAHAFYLWRGVMPETAELRSQLKA